MIVESSHYSMVIEWSDEDRTFIVSFPEWGKNTHTHGATYAEAVQNGQEALADLSEFWHEQGRSLPQVHIFVRAYRDAGALYS